jgi:hypothetical protein
MQVTPIPKQADVEVAEGPAIIIVLLLQAGSDLSAKSSLDDIPLQYAIKY